MINSTIIFIIIHKTFTTIAKILKASLKSLISYISDTRSLNFVIKTIIFLLYLIWNNVVINILQVFSNYVNQL